MEDGAHKIVNVDIVHWTNDRATSFKRGTIRNQDPVHRAIDRIESMVAFLVMHRRHLGVLTRLNMPALFGHYPDVGYARVVTQVKPVGKEIGFLADPRIPLT
jgi:hypothetical protein